VTVYVLLTSPNLLASDICKILCFNLVTDDDTLILMFDDC